MALIHIDPVPPRCQPGEVLKFIAERGKLDGKHIGKIAFVGRGATVEVPDAKAASLVAALDGATFRDKPIRVRFAGKADFTDANHFAHLSRLLDLEARAEQEEARSRVQNETGVDDGTTLTALELRDAEFGLGGRLLLTFGRKNRTDPLPPSRLQSGSPVLLNQTNVNRRLPSYRGVVFDRDAVSIGVAIDPPDDDLPDDAVWRLDLSPDEISRLRQQDALRRAAAATGDRLADLRAILLGEREPEFVERTDSDGEQLRLSEATLNHRGTEDTEKRTDGGQLRLSEATQLNEPQSAAVEFALSAKDVAIIHGPPGTGKTTAVVEFIRQAVARGDTVLACAPSNHAVDNLLEKLLNAGELPVRLGHPARVVPALRARALDILAEKHPDARQARKVAKEAFTLFRQADKWTRGKPEPGAKAAMRKEARDLLSESRRLEALAIERVLDESRVVCATLTGLDSQLLGQRRYNLAVLDEACQSTEPAAWVPLLRSEKLVLAGDHCQLPATVISPEAAEQGLAISLMERLIARFGTSISRLLTVQHRMHETIMGFSNAAFYEGLLVAHETVAGHRLCDLPGVRSEPLTETPLQFIDTAGAGYDEEIEEDTKSRLNRQEADLAARKVRQLLETGVFSNQIGVITPYRAQVRRLRELLSDIPGLEVDSVDGFQGREKEAIVVSFVRSNPEGEIGFLNDTRRTNVAFTRARRKLIVIGDSATLANHPFYQQILTYFEGIGAYSSVWEEL
ncbi:MAG TPA: AAA domain-containing protein [Gemmata sp.]|nr:AAA domain-containing protein [Gemmata sp.]